MCGGRLRQIIASTTVGMSRFLLASPLLAIVLPVCAQQPSLRRYDISDGLAHNQVKAIHQDRKGYLWFGTLDGLSRFDGYRFTNYGSGDGLGHAIINDIAENREGQLWVATNGSGVARLREASSEKASNGLTNNRVP